MRLNRDKRYQMEVLLEAGIPQKDIARMLGISPGGLSKEISRNGGAKRYDPEKAEKRATRLAKKSHVHLKFNDEVWAEVKRIEWKLNNRPRKRLGYLTPLEYISGHVKQIYLAT